MNHFFIVAHRGGVSDFKENTLQAFKYGLANGANAVEMDVRFDGLRSRFYLEHDFFHPAKNKENVIEKVIPFLPKDATLFIEVKTLAWIRKKYALHFLKMVEDFALAKRAIVISYNPFVLLHLKKRMPSLPIGIIVSNRLLAFIWINFFFFALRPEFIMLHKRMLYKKKALKAFMKFVKKQRVKTLIFTPNSEADWQKVKDLNFEGIITDYPLEAKQFFKEEKV